MTLPESITSVPRSIRSCLRPMSPDTASPSRISAGWSVATRSSEIRSNICTSPDPTPTATRRGSANKLSTGKRRSAALMASRAALAAASALAIGSSSPLLSAPASSSAAAPSPKSPSAMATARCFRRSLRRLALSRRSSLTSTGSSPGCRPIMSDSGSSLHSLSASQGMRGPRGRLGGNAAATAAPACCTMARAARSSSPRSSSLASPSSRRVGRPVRASRKNRLAIWPSRIRARSLARSRPDMAARRCCSLARSSSSSSEDDDAASAARSRFPAAAPATVSPPRSSGESPVAPRPARSASWPAV
mmetsp:Transcript_18911/g.72120  ORF Transcript_18911/g.72120 Transcript_18911/m.72120 type:complete len:305 (+) Transcript_18911:282-1196(+)